MEKQHILEEIKRTAGANGGKALGKMNFLRATGIKDTDWRGKHWARWGDAVREAGFEPNEKTTAFDEILLIEKVICLIRELGRFPVESELRLKSRADPSFPCSTTIAVRLGSKRQQVATIQKYCDARPGYEDVLTHCIEATRERPTESNTGEEDGESEGNPGFVYLMKSGRHYKIGRSNAAGRREYELAIQLPERAVTVHVIRTDDPVGIEEYWHKRFGEKRKNGEWFDLSSTDVSAFKRRKFM